MSCHISLKITIIHDTTLSLQKKKIITAFIKKLSSQKNIKITYKTINSDINFKDKENEIKKNIDAFINQMLVSLE